MHAPLLSTPYNFSKVFWLEQSFYEKRLGQRCYGKWKIVATYIAFIWLTLILLPLIKILLSLKGGFSFYVSNGVPRYVSKGLSKVVPKDVSKVLCNAVSKGESKGVSKKVCIVHGWVQGAVQGGVKGVSRGGKGGGSQKKEFSQLKIKTILSSGGKFGCSSFTQLQNTETWPWFWRYMERFWWDMHFVNIWLIFAENTHNILVIRYDLVTFSNFYQFLSRGEWDIKYPIIPIFQLVYIVLRGEGVYAISMILEISYLGDFFTDIPCYHSLITCDFI